MWDGAGITLSDSTHFSNGQFTDREQKGGKEEAAVKDRTTLRWRRKKQKWMERKTEENNKRQSKKITFLSK